MPITYAPRYEEEFPWSSPDQSDRGAARCKWCNKSFKIDTMGRVAFQSHEKGKLHQSQINVRRTNMKLTCFQSQVKSSDVSGAVIPVKDFDVASTAESEPTSSGYAANMKKYVLRDKVVTAEILWALETVFTHNSNRSASADVDIFKKMFPDSEIASQMRMGRTKIGYLITFGVAPSFQDNLFKTLNQTSRIVVGFDESLNKIAQRQQMDISVRYYDKEKREVQTNYVGSAFLSSTRANDLLIGMKECFKSNPSILKKIVQISMDGPNVNWKFLQDLSGYGNIAPRTTLGRIVTLAYALLGIPLTLVYLSSTGGMLAKVARGVFSRVFCCCLCSNCGYCCYDEKRMAEKERRMKRKRQQMELRAQHIALQEPYYVRSGSLHNNLHSPEKQVPMISDIDSINGTDSESRTSMHGLSILAPILLCIAMMSIYIAFGAFALYKLEDWPIIDGVYFCFMCLSTIGFGDMVPGLRKESTMTTWFCSIYIMSGMALTAMCFNVLHEEIMHRLKHVVEIQKKLKLSDEHKDFLAS